MKNSKARANLLIIAVASTGCYLLLTSSAWAHCDTTSGPVIAEAKVALEKGDITPLLKWVNQENEAEVKAVFTGSPEKTDYKAR